MDLTIILHTRDDWFLAKDCILSIKKVYEKNETILQPIIILISDGHNPQGLTEWCHQENVNYVIGERLYLLNHGGKWIKRWLEEGLRTNTEWILRIDPDTRIFNPLPLKHGKNIEVVSPYFNHPEDLETTRLHGSFQMIRKQSALKIIESKLLDDKKYLDEKYSSDYNQHLPEERKFKNNRDRSICVNEDLIFSEVCNSLKLKTKDANSIINCWWRNKPDETELLKEPIAQHPYYKIENIKSRIFGIGLGRTGTSSLNNALNLLGFDTIHYNTTIKSIDDVYRIFENYEGYVDVPMASIYKDVDKLYPNSKFILTVRNAIYWAESVKAYTKEWLKMQKETENMLTDEMLETRNKTINFLKDYGTSIYGDYLPEIIDTPKINAILLETYYRHFNQVTKYFEGREEDLLILDVSEQNAFTQLAEFLNREAPQPNMPVRNTINEVISIVRDNKKAIIRAYNQRLEQENRIKNQEIEKLKEQEKIEEIKQIIEESSDYEDE